MSMNSDQSGPESRGGPAGPAKDKTQTPGWFTALFFVGFLVWCWYYLFVLRPEMNHWLAQYISGYPAMLHLIPIIGVPAIVAIVLAPLVSKPPRKS